jgi:hypothetical protein
VKLLLTILLLVTINAKAENIINLEADVRVAPGTDGCRLEDKGIRTQFKYYENPERGIADWVGIVQFKPKFRQPSRIPRAGLDLSKSKDAVFPVEEPEGCNFAATTGTITGSDDDEINLIFIGKSCEPIIDIFAKDQFKELGLEWSLVAIGDGEEILHGLTMTIHNACK